MKLTRCEGVASGIRLLEAWIDSAMAYRWLPGLSIGIVHDQELIWARGFGYADREQRIPAAPDTVYRIASISKLFTAVAVMQLRDRGLLGLDDPLERHLPWFRIGGVDPLAQPVTLRHLLTHTAGLPREAAFPYWTDLQFPTSEQLRERLPGQEMVRAPEIKWKYSNLGLALAGDVVETVSGEPFADYVQAHILEPLGMTSSSVGVPDTLRPRLAAGYGRRLPDGTRSLRPHTNTRGIAPAAGLVSTVEDLARFASLQFRGGAAGANQVLKGTTLREMHRVHWVRPDRKGGWGLGFSTLRRDGRDIVGHGGWVPGHQTAFSLCLEEKIGVIALYNADDGQPYPGRPDSVVDRAFKWVAPAIVAATKPRAARPGIRLAWRKYLGRYRSAWSDVHVLVFNGRLTLINPTEQDPEGVRLTLVPTGEHTFRTESTAAFVEDGDPVRFEVGANGRVLRIKIGENYSKRLR